jgi:hypothetical protein
MPPDPRPTPEQKYLQKKRAELAELESLLAERELELHTLRGGLLAFEKQYQAVVGVKFEELDQLRARVAELAPMAPTDSTADEKTQAKKREPSKARTRSKSKSAAVKPAPAPPAPPAFNPAESLKKLYRDVAKSLHPDLADSEESRTHRHGFMIRVNQAYEAGDQAALLAVFHEWEHAPESVEGKGAAADLVRAIRKIDWCEQRLVNIAGEIEQLHTSGLFGMKMMSEEATQFERDLLAEMTGRIDAEIAVVREQVARLEQQTPQTPAEPGG